MRTAGAWRFVCDLQEILPETGVAALEGQADLTEGQLEGGSRPGMDPVNPTDPTRRD